MKQKLANLYGAYYYHSNTPATHSSRENDLYTYTAYIGQHSVYVPKGDSMIHYAEGQAYWTSGADREILTGDFGVVLRGYQCGRKLCSIDQNVNLPYVNGCATRQIFPPERVGDPTLQQLTIPPHTSEQMHHIHSTPRVVYVVEGMGYSIVGQSEECEETKLVPGMMCVLDPMSPHHFRTEGEFLTVLPVHVFSSTPPSIEESHPMFNGTKEI